MVTDEERKARRAEYDRRYREANRWMINEKARLYQRARKDKIPEHMKELKNKASKKWRERNGEAIARYASKARKAASEALSDVYIKSLLCRWASLQSADIPQDLIEAKRQQIALLRASKAIKTELGNQK